MECNYFEYLEMTEKMFFGTPLTDSHMNEATEQLRLYLINGGAGQIVKDLGIGIKVEERVFGTFPELNEVIRRRFIWLGGERKDKELSIDEIRGIGMFLKNGAFYGRCKITDDSTSVSGKRNGKSENLA